MSASTRGLQIGERVVGPGQPVFIVAEIGINHNGRLDLALELIEVAAGAGADAVKFQKRSLEDLYQRKILLDPNLGEQSFQYMIPLLREVELGRDEFQRIRKRCSELGVEFLCTPFDLPSVDFLEPFDLPAVKIASADLTNLLLLERAIELNRPLLLSLGMALLEEVDATVAFLRERHASFLLLHTSSTYPAPAADLNLRLLPMLAERYEVAVGYSGHERGYTPTLGAVALGASLVERHITVDRSMEGPDHAASLEPQEFASLVRAIRELEIALGRDRKLMSRGEVLNREILGKSLVAAQDIPRGAVIQRHMVTAKSPGKGLSPQRLYDLVGRPAVREIHADEEFTEADLGAATEIQEPQRLGGLWGLKARFHNLDDLLPLGPRLLEFHFSDRDLDTEYAAGALDLGLFIHAPEYWFRQMVDLCSPNPARREASVRVLQRTIDKAREMASRFRGSPTLVVHVGGMDLEPREDPAPLLDRAAECIRRLDTGDVRILPENLPPRPWYFAGQYYQNAFVGPEEMVEFCRSLRLGMCLDLSHAKLYCNLQGRSLEDYVQIVEPLVEHVHISDAAGIDGEGLQIGEGEIDFESVLTVLSQRQFSWVPEIWRGHLHQARGFRIALDRLSRFPHLAAAAERA